MFQVRNAHNFFHAPSDGVLLLHQRICTKHINACKRIHVQHAHTFTNIQRSASGSPEDEDHPQDGTWGRERERERAFQERSGAADEMHTGPSQTGEVIGDEIAFVGVNKAIENRVCINLRRMSWAESPRTMFLVEKTDGWRSLNCDGRRLEHLCVVALERICRYCKENLNLTVIVEVALCLLLFFWLRVSRFLSLSVNPILPPPPRMYMYMYICR